MRALRTDAVGGSDAKRLAVAVCVVLTLSALLAVLFSSPDERPSTIAQWAHRQPLGFLATALAELEGSSRTAEYGPPYNHVGAGELAAFFRPQRWLGVSRPIDTAEDFVIDPLRSLRRPALQREIGEYEEASLSLKEDGWMSYRREMSRASVGRDGSVHVRAGEYENVENLMSALLAFAQSGGLEGFLTHSRGFSQTDYTKPLLLMTDGGVPQERAVRERLRSRQWITMDESGSYPGLPWLWPYALWYEVPPLKASHNTNLLAALAMLLLSLAIVCAPYVPGIRDAPRWLPLHRVIWREHYRRRRLPA